jgi:hypothetical protein
MARKTTPRPTGAQDQQQDVPRPVNQQKNGGAVHQQRATGGRAHQPEFSPSAQKGPSMSDAPERKTGKMIFYVPARGFGFIAADNCDVQFMARSCSPAERRAGELYRRRRQRRSANRPPSHALEIERPAIPQRWLVVRFWGQLVGWHQRVPGGSPGQPDHKR